MLIIGVIPTPPAMRTRPAQSRSGAAVNEPCGPSSHTFWPCRSAATRCEKSPWSRTVSSSRPVTFALEAMVNGCSSVPTTARLSRSHTNWPGSKRMPPRRRCTGASTRVETVGPSRRTP
jgi:hypothetical protein